MGADFFETRASGATPQEAFTRAVEKARYDYGHRGYTGTIAEKRSFKVVRPRAGEEPMACVKRCAEDDDHFSQDKWGDAACVDVGPDPAVPGSRIYLFFGYASS